MRKNGVLGQTPVMGKAKTIEIDKTLNLNMATSIIKVYNNKYGKWERNAKVILGWSGMVNLGMSNAVYTNSDGMAIIDHSSTGSATVYINGKNKGKMNTPGSKTFEI